LPPARDSSTPTRPPFDFTNDGSRYPGAALTEGSKRTNGDCEKRTYLRLCIRPIAQRYHHSDEPGTVAVSLFPIPARETGNASTRGYPAPRLESID
jgi:hypothetical protein